MLALPEHRLGMRPVRVDPIGLKSRIGGIPRKNRDQLAGKASDLKALAAFHAAQCSPFRNDRGASVAKQQSTIINRRESSAFLITTSARSAAIFMPDDASLESVDARAKNFRGFFHKIGATDAIDDHISGKICLIALGTVMEEFSYELQ